MLQCNLNGIKIYLHKTYELVNIIKDKCDLIITLNITRSCLKALADKNETVCFFACCYRDVEDLVKERYYVASNHLKLYRTKSKVYISTANLSLSNWLEVTIELNRSEELDRFIDALKSKLKLVNNFYKDFY